MRGYFNLLKRGINLPNGWIFWVDIKLSTIKGRTRWHFPLFKNQMQLIIAALLSAFVTCLPLPIQSNTLNFGDNTATNSQTILGQISDNFSGDAQQNSITSTGNLGGISQMQTLGIKGNQAENQWNTIGASGNTAVNQQLAAFSDHNLATNQNSNINMAGNRASGDQMIQTEMVGNQAFAQNNALLLSGNFAAGNQFLDAEVKGNVANIQANTVTEQGNWANANGENKAVIAGNTGLWSQQNTGNIISNHANLDELNICAIQANGAGVDGQGNTCTIAGNDPTTQRNIGLILQNTSQGSQASAVGITGNFNSASQWNDGEITGNTAQNWQSNTVGITGNEGGSQTNTAMITDNAARFSQTNNANAAQNTATDQFFKGGIIRNTVF